MRVTARCGGWVWGAAFGLATLSGGVASATPVPVNWLPANGASSVGSTATGFAGVNLSDVVVGDRAIQFCAAGACPAGILLVGENKLRGNE